MQRDLCDDAMDVEYFEYLKYLPHTWVDFSIARATHDCDPECARLSDDDNLQQTHVQPATGELVRSIEEVTHTFAWLPTLYVQRVKSDLTVCLQS